MNSTIRIPRHLLSTAHIGFEREILRLKADLEPSTLRHPYVDKISHPFIKTDFSDIQLELITPPKNTPEEACDFLDNVLSVVQDSGEVLWNQSMPPAMTGDIPISRFNRSAEGIRLEQYRRHLAKKYGKAKMLISGFHYNFSYNEALLRHLYTHSGQNVSFQSFSNKTYLAVMQNFNVLRWLIIYLTGATPRMDEVHPEFCPCDDSCSQVSPHSFSLRNGPCGYRNNFDFTPSTESLSAYVQDIKKLLAEDKIRFPAELYIPVRLKHSSAKTLDDLEKKGVEYLELRCFDIDPYTRRGMSKKTARFIYNFMHYLLFSPPRKSSRYDTLNHDLVSVYGLQPNLALYVSTGEKTPLGDYGRAVLDDMETVLSHHMDPADYMESVNWARSCLESPQHTCAHRCKTAIEARGFRSFGLDQSHNLKNFYTREAFTFFGTQKLELSTIILLKEALIAGIGFEILDEAGNFCALNRGKKTEYVKQATKTGADSYAAVLAMENKVVTKQILGKYALSVPRGFHFTREKDALSAYEYFSHKATVVKPNSTNFGIAVEIFTRPPSFLEYTTAVKRAFAEDECILIEEFFPGNEYRFFIINNRVAGVLRRVPANVCGDGIHTIEKLVKVKNQNPLRGTGYTKPLEKITLQAVEITFLENQGLTPHSVPPKNTTVYLRENSNISTGGDSIDVTDQIHYSYKDIALEAAEILRAKICGIDMILRTPEDRAETDNHTIIEANFNPAIHIHCYPARGKRRRLGREVLSQIGFDTVLS
jgi:glutamate--cysteine ligase